MALRNILLAAIAVGLITGIVYGLFQQTQISPIIYGAEQFEVLDAPSSHSHGTQELASASAEASTPAWSPEDGAERIFSTMSANVTIAIAYALMMISLMALHNAKANKPKITATSGALWGVAALLALFIAPALFGLHPEVPGTVAAELINRQQWWMFCAGISLAGLAALYYAPTQFKFIGVILLAAPHIVGAPLPESHGFANTDPVAIQTLTALTSEFFIMTTIGMSIFFVLLGSLSGFAVQRFVKL
ncbi:MAG: CbtA family protein [Oceanospirillaceae bacterium]